MYLFGVRFLGMTKEFRANRIVVEVDDRLLAAVDDEAAARSTNIRKVSRTEVMRELIAQHLADPRDSKKVGVTR